MQVTTNHWNISRKNFIHDATVSWVHTVNYENFEVSVEKDVWFILNDSVLTNLR